MIFTDSVFPLFLAAFSFFWVLLKDVRPFVILIASFIFYGAAGAHYTIILAFVILQTYILAFYVKNNRSILLTSILLNLIVLGYFKYSFFIAGLLFDQSVTSIFEGIILPVGISFYIFQSMSYVIDVYKGELKNERNLINYGAFVSFFPQLVAGPIERASRLLPQISKSEHQIVPGSFAKISIGLFAKVMIADQLAPYVDRIFSSYEDIHIVEKLLGGVYFSIQIYGDFFGYSLIAIGVAGLFGIKLMENFNYPYYATSLSEFWRRWHISLSSFFSDYVYKPLGGSKFGLRTLMISTFVTFLASGLWHGANLTFILWGGIHGILVFLEKLVPLERVNGLVRLAYVYFTVLLLWILFRIDSIEGYAIFLSDWNLGTDIKNSSGVLVVLMFLIFETSRKYLIGVAPYCLLFAVSLSELVFRNGNTPFIYFAF